MKTKMVRMLVQVPENLKHRLDALRTRGYTASGFVRHLLEREFAKSTGGATTAGKTRQKGGGH
jgi:hypothetical protein